jgi:hypothetical protein
MGLYGLNSSGSGQEPAQGPSKYGSEQWCHKILGNSWVSERLMTSQGLSSMELVTYLLSYISIAISQCI